MDFEPEINPRYRKPTAPCPKCECHIKHGEMECYHCGYELTVDDIRTLKQYMRKQWFHGMWICLKIIPIAIILFALYFSLFE
ncbi:hypothetical protein [Colwellia echini]|uniref:Zinc ribbon domain-containing protein n=1 Tax=Colwellia echini TaxID=1982103 RepID=A0ABY3MSP4_9GAMM|nr:hypothetical protein [Colwellia echini]TYK64164.1 hypothetical protein CWS31_017135 [Colwellia echini]